MRLGSLGIKMALFFFSESIFRPGHRGLSPAEWKMPPANNNNNKKKKNSNEDFR